MPGTLVFLVAGGLLGIVTHLGVFIRGEWHVQAPQLAVSHACVLLCVVLYQSDGLALATLAYLTGLFTSILFYRVSKWHRLTAVGFPGPLGARITKLWHVVACRHSRNHELLDRLHQEYGDFVRTGPSEITVYHPDVFMAIDGPRTECIKSEWYDILHPNVSLVSTRDKATHGARRRQWNRGFSNKALQQHKAKIHRHIDKLDQRIAADADHGRVSDAKKLMYWFGFDAMGDFVFNHSFSMLDNGTWHHIMVRAYRAIELMGPFSPAPWLVQIGLRLLPRVVLGKLADWDEMTTWCRRTMEQRLQDEALQEELDMTHYLMMQDAEPEEVTSPGEHGVSKGEGSGDYYAANQEHNRFWLHGDSLLVIVAGSAPIATALTFLLRELAQQPSQLEKLYSELQGVEATDLDALCKLPHLDACLTETLRLWPGLFTGGARKTGHNGVWIAGRFVPAETTIVAPAYVIARREDCFVRARDFVPERWTSSPELVRNAAASAPFGTGASSCVGRVLATDVIKYTAARLVRKYTFSLAPDHHVSRGLRSEARDFFLPRPGELNLCFQRRVEEKVESLLGA